MNSLMRLLCLVGCLLSMAVMSLPIRSVSVTSDSSATTLSSPATTLSSPATTLSSSATTVSASLPSVFKYWFKHELIVIGTLSALLVLALSVVGLAWILRKSPTTNTDDSEVPMTSCHSQDPKKYENTDQNAQDKVETTPPVVVEEPTTGELESVIVVVDTVISPSAIRGSAIKGSAIKGSAIRVSAVSDNTTSTSAVSDNTTSASTVSVNTTSASAVSTSTASVHTTSNSTASASTAKLHSEKPSSSTTAKASTPKSLQPNQSSSDKLRQELSSFNRTPDSKLQEMLQRLRLQPPPNEGMRAMLEFVSDSANLRDATEVELMRKWMRAFLFDKYAS